VNSNKNNDLNMKKIISDEQIKNKKILIVSGGSSKVN
jgi:hypothetical protein